MLRSEVREVLLDLVVRQKNHRMVRGLTASDFTVTENGVVQEIRQFRLVTGTGARSAGRHAGVVAEETPGKSVDSNALAEPVPEKYFITIVFEELSPASRKYATDAALDFIKHAFSSNTYFGVFSLGLDSNLYRLQDFSNDRIQTLSTIKDAVLGNYSSLTAGKSKVENTFGFDRNDKFTIDPFKTPEAGRADASTVLGKSDAILQYRQREIAMYMGGMRTISGLLTLIDYESRLPGRKTVLYLCEGLNLPPGQRDRLSEVVGAANQANVSFYGVDARGLMTTNANALAVHLSLENANASARQIRAGATGVDENLAKAEDSQVVMGVANTQLNLSELSERTGGFAVADTNELNQQILRVVEDVGSHYELTYVPRNRNDDGAFRKSLVTTKNKQLEVQTRDGYYALPELNGHPLELFELPAFQALESKSPSGLPSHLVPIRFRNSDGSVKYELAFGVDGRDITAVKSRIHVVFLALVKNAQGVVVGKISGDFDRLIPNADLDRFARGSVIFSDSISLDRGHYTVEGAVCDLEGKRTGIKRIALSVPAPEATSVSDIVLVSAVEGLVSEPDPSDPFQFPGGRIIPQLDGTLSGHNSVSLYFVIESDRVADSDVVVAFLHNGKVIAENHPTLDRTKGGSVPVIVSATLPNGHYQARLTVNAGSLIVRWISFSIVPE